MFIVTSSLTLITSMLATTYIFLASIGHNFIIHRFYAHILLKLFDYGDKGVKRINQQMQIQRRNDKLISKTVSSPTILANETASNKSACLDSDNNTDSAFDSDNSDFDDEFDGKFAKDGSGLSLNLTKKCKLAFDLSAMMDFTSSGIQAIVDDEVTKRFVPEELKIWNLLTRTDKLYHYKSFRLAFIWLMGCMFRYLFLFPIRFFFKMFGLFLLIFSTTMISLMPDSKLKRILYNYSIKMCFRVLSLALSAMFTYHNRENKAKPGGICVANHTTPIDAVVLQCDNAYAMVAQRHGGFLGFLQKTLDKASKHIYFNRFELSDRQVVTRKLKEHTENMNNLPILIFPEGTCINNSAVMMFKKGSFEIGSPIYPVAIKYDARFGDPFWNSSKNSFAQYLLMMMTSWAIVCDIWYLPPMYKHEHESSIQFANRVKSQIASKGGLVDLNWDGQLKRQPVKPEMVQFEQYKFSQTLYLKDNNENFIYSDKNPYCTKQFLNHNLRV